MGCRSPKLALGLYDREGRLIEALEEIPEQMFQKTLPPGQGLAVRLRPVPDQDGRALTVKAWADCAEPF